MTGQRALIGGERGASTELVPLLWNIHSCDCLPSVIMRTYAVLNVTTEQCIWPADPCSRTCTHWRDGAPRLHPPWDVWWQLWCWMLLQPLVVTSSFSNGIHQRRCYNWGFWGLTHQQLSKCTPAGTSALVHKSSLSFCCYYNCNVMIDVQR